MNAQLPLPAGWAIDHLLGSRSDPQTRLDQLRRDMIETKVEIRSALEKLARKHGIPAPEINRAIRDYADDMLSDLVYELERDLNRAIEDKDPI
jgi:hypothetical protein